MPNAVTLAGRRFEFGDLTGAVLEDHYDSITMFLQMTGVPTKDQFSALLTLAHQSMVAGGWQGTREDAVKLVRYRDSVALGVAVGKALGFEVGGGAQTGEAEGPQSSPA